MMIQIGKCEKPDVQVFIFYLSCVQFVWLYVHIEIMIEIRFHH